RPRRRELPAPHDGDVARRQARARLEAGHRYEVGADGEDLLMRLALLGAIILCAAVAAAAYLTNAGAGSARAAVAQAAVKTANAGTSRVLMLGQEAGGEVRLDGLLDYEHGRASFTTSVPRDGEGPASLTLTVLVIGSSLYFQIVDELSGGIK